MALASAPGVYAGSPSTSRPSLSKGSEPPHSSPSPCGSSVAGSWMMLKRAHVPRVPASAGVAGARGVQVVVGEDPVVGAASCRRASAASTCSHRARVPRNRCRPAARSRPGTRAGGRSGPATRGRPRPPPRPAARRLRRMSRRPRPARPRAATGTSGPAHADDVDVAAAGRRAGDRERFGVCRGGCRRARTASWPGT